MIRLADWARKIHSETIVHFYGRFPLHAEPASLPWEKFHLMNVTLSVPFDWQAKPACPSNLQRLVREILSENALAMERAITAGSLTVSIPPEEAAIKIEGLSSGYVRFVVGGCDRISEIVPFEIDWRARKLEMCFSKMKSAVFVEETCQGIPAVSLASLE